MNAVDLDIGLSGPRVTASGDLALVTGVASLSAWAGRCAMSQRTTLIHRPDFGAGLLRWLGAPGTATLDGAAADLEIALARDARVRRVATVARFAQDAAARLEIAVTVTAVDGQTATFDVRA